MIVKKVITNNFITPGKRVYDFTYKVEGGANFLLHKNNDFDVLKNLLEGGWIKHTLTFEEFTPFFENYNNNVDLEIEALIELDDEEAAILAHTLMGNDNYPRYSRLYLYKIIAEAPYLVPVIILEPIDPDPSLKHEIPIVIGEHYKKFCGYNLTKDEVLVASAIQFIGSIKIKFYEYKKIKASKNSLDIHKKYLDILKTIFRNPVPFINKLTNMAKQFPDLEILSFGDEAQYYKKSSIIESFLGSYKLFIEAPEIKEDFFQYLWEYFLSELQVVYKTYSSVDTVDVRKILEKYDIVNAISFNILKDVLVFHQDPLQNVSKIKDKREKEKMINHQKELLKNQTILIKTQEDFLSVINDEFELEEETIDFGDLEF